MSRKRIFALGALIAVLAVAVAGRFVRGTRMAAVAWAAAEPATSHPVQTVPAARRSFERTVQVQGNVSAKHYADVPARIFGTLDAVFVDEGDAVEKGVTKLFQVDRANLERALQIAAQNLAVARCGERESAANLERVNADLDKATVDYERFQRLFAQHAATKDAVEQYESRFKQVTAVQNHAKTMTDLTAEQTRQAAIALDIAKKNLSDSVVRAPLSGVVTQRLAEPGEIADPGKTIVRIEDLSLLEVSAYLAAAEYAAVKTNETQMRVASAGIDAGSHPVSYKSPTIQAQLRTFELRCLLEAPPAGIVPGAMADITLVLDRQEGLRVPRDAVLSRGGQSVVFVVENGKAHMVPVKTGLASDGWIGAQGDGLTEGAAVVSVGQDMLNDGAPVTVQEGGQ